MAAEVSREMLTEEQVKFLAGLPHDDLELVMVGAADEAREITDRCTGLEDSLDSIYRRLAL